MKVNTSLLWVVAMLSVRPVVADDSVSHLQPGTYAVQQRKEIQYTPTEQQPNTQPSAEALSLEVFMPKEVERTVPAVVIINGSGDHPVELAKVATWLASHGYAVFAPSYRSEAERSAACKDITATIRFVRRHHVEFDVDPNRIALWGIADGGPIAMVCALRNEPLSHSRQKKSTDRASAISNASEAASARLQAVMVMSVDNPLDDRVTKHASFDDPPLLLVLRSETGEDQPIDTPAPLAEAGIEFQGYEVDCDGSPPQLTSTVSTADGERPVWQLALSFTDEHLKQPPLNIATELESEILQRIRAQDYVLGTQSIIDLRALLRMAARRLGREPTPEEMEVARDHAEKFADSLVRTAARGGGYPRITRVVFAQAVSRLSPLWPFTSRKRPATVPPVSRDRLLPKQSKDD